MQLCDEIFLKKPLAAVFEFFARDVFHPHIHCAHMQTKKKKEKTREKPQDHDMGAFFSPSNSREKESHNLSSSSFCWREGGRKRGGHDLKLAARSAHHGFPEKK